MWRAWGEKGYAATTRSMQNTWKWIIFFPSFYKRRIIALNIFDETTLTISIHRQYMHWTMAEAHKIALRGQSNSIYYTFYTISFRLRILDGKLILRFSLFCCSILFHFFWYQFMHLKEETRSKECMLWIQHFEWQGIRSFKAILLWKKSVDSLSSVGEMQ